MKNKMNRDKPCGIGNEEKMNKNHQYHQKSRKIIIIALLILKVNNLRFRKVEQKYRRLSVSSQIINIPKKELTQVKNKNKNKKLGLY